VEKTEDHQRSIACVNLRRISRLMINPQMNVEIPTNQAFVALGKRQKATPTL
jgi:hypothetical protein